MYEPSEVLNKLSERIIAAAIEVHKEIGPGYLEGIYGEALAIELSLRKISFERQKSIPLKYKGHFLGKGRLDLLVENMLVLELKTIETFAEIHKAQMISYLKASGCHLGLLINFNVPVLKTGIKRIIYS